MTSIKKLEANQRNAQKSTGPRSAEGKAKVSLNALKHGVLAETALLPDEDKAAFKRFREAVLAGLKPANAVEELLAMEIVNLAWRLRRVNRVEAGLFIREQAAAEEDWLRAQLRELEVTGIDKWLNGGMLFALGRSDQTLPLRLTEEVVEIVDLNRHGELVRQLNDAVAEGRSEFAALAGAFARDAAAANAFSKLGRYETGIARRLSRMLQELTALQEARLCADETGTSTEATEEGDGGSGS